MAPNLTSPQSRVTYTAEWDGHLAGKARDTITARAEEIKEDYDDLTELAKDTEFVNAIEKRFEVQVGKDYYVYESKQSGKFLSIIEPHAVDNPPLNRNTIMGGSDSPQTALGSAIPMYEWQKDIESQIPCRTRSQGLALQIPSRCLLPVLCWSRTLVIL